MRRVLSPALRGLLTALLLLGAACATSPGGGGGADEEPVAPSFDPIVFPHANGLADGPEGGNGALREERRVEDEDAGWAEKLELARGYATGGYDDEAIAIIRGTLAQDPPAPWAERFRNLRASIRIRQVETGLLRADARGTRDYVPFDADVDFRVRIRNVSDAEIVFPAPQSGPGGRSPTALSLEVARRDIDIYGAELTRSWTQTVYLQQAGGGDIRVPPGSAHEVPARIAAVDAGQAISGLRVLELSGVLRGVVQTGDEEPQTISLRVRPGRVVALPSGYEPLARDSLGSMDAAISAAAPTHLLVASEFVARSRVEQGMRHLARALTEGDPALRTAALSSIGRLRRRAVGLRVADFTAPLVEALAVHPDRSDALLDGLRRATSQSLAPDPRLWVDWWRRAHEEGSVVVSSAPGDDGGAEGR